MFLPVILLINCWRNTARFLYRKLYRDIKSMTLKTREGVCAFGQDTYFSLKAPEAL